MQTHQNYIFCISQLKHSCLFFLLEQWKQYKTNSIVFISFFIWIYYIITFYPIFGLAMIGKEVLNLKKGIMDCLVIPFSSISLFWP